jgi:hypothetical protein
MKKQRKETAPGVENQSGKPDLATVEIDGNTYRLSFELKDLAESERFYQREGREVNLLFAIPEMSLSSMREVFPCAVRKFHPELGWAGSQELVTLRSVHTIALAVAAALGANTATPIAGETAEV